MTSTGEETHSGKRFKSDEDYEAPSPKDKLRKELFEALRKDDVAKVTELLKNPDIDVNAQYEVCTCSSFGIAVW